MNANPHIHIESGRFSYASAHENKNQFIHNNINVIVRVCEDKNKNKTSKINFS